MDPKRGNAPFKSCSLFFKFFFLIASWNHIEKLGLDRLETNYENISFIIKNMNKQNTLNTILFLLLIFHNFRPLKSVLVRAIFILKYLIKNTSFNF